jgi:hypothetical protein
MNILKLTFSLLLLLFFYTNGFAQKKSWEWAIPLGNKIFTYEKYSEGLVQIRAEDPKSGNYLRGFMDEKGQIIIKPIYDWAESFSDGLALVSDQKMYFFINKKGEEVSPKFESAKSFSENLAAVKTDEKYGYINTLGEWIIKPTYQLAAKFSEGLAAVKIDGRYVYINTKGEIILDHKYLISDEFSEGLISIKNEEDQYGYMNKKGEIVIPCQYKASGDFSEGMALVGQSYDAYGFIDKKGTLVIPFQYSAASHFSQGLAAVKLYGKHGYINKKGKMVIPAKYDEALDFSEGLALVRLYKGNTKYMLDGYINIWGEEVIPIKFHQSLSFSNGLAKVYTEEKEGYIRYIPKYATPLELPNTADWEIHDLGNIINGLQIKLPKGTKTYNYETNNGISIFINDVISNAIEIEGLNTLDIKNERNWLDNSPSRWGLTWLIDHENEAYYTGLDLTAPKGHQITHSCYAQKFIGGKKFILNIDGITIDGSNVNNLSQEDCLMYLAAFRSLQIK